MNIKRIRVYAPAYAAAALLFGACVDHDYDLTQDIDLKVNLGGEQLTLPASSTADITLVSILDLDAESSIHAVEIPGEYGLEVGDYVLVQDGNSEPATYGIKPVEITTHPSSTTETVVPTFVNINGLKVTQTASASVNSVNLSDDNVDKQLIRLDDARMNMILEFHLTYKSPSGFDGTAYIENGYRVEFPDAWTVEPADAASAAFLSNVNSHVLEFRTAGGEGTPFSATHPLVARIRLLEVDFAAIDDPEQGLYAPGHFRLDSSVESMGDVSLESDSHFPVGSSADLTLVTTTDITNATITEVTGIVDPDVNVDPTSFTITDIPDFLKDEQNNLEIENPQINFTVSNSSPLTLNVNGQLTSYATGNVEIQNVKIGAANGTAAIIVPPSSVTDFVISAKPMAGVANNIVVPDLSRLISTVPDEIRFHDISVKAEQIPVTFDLFDENDPDNEKKYTFNADYHAVIPLAFGEHMTLHYVHEDTGWDEDLEKYNFNKVEISLEAVNSIPLDMTPKAVALRRVAEGSEEYVELTTVTAVVEGNVAPGTIAAPKSSPLKITLASTGENIKELDGIQLIFDAKSNAEVAGVNLNENQALRFEQIKVKIIGGVTVDLND